MSRNLRRRKPHRHPPGYLGQRFWSTPTGRVTAGVAVLAALATGVALIERTQPTPPAAPVLASAGPSDERQAPSFERAGGTQVDGMGRSLPSQGAEPLSRDPAARVPQAEAWRKNAVAAGAPNDRPMIAVVIDDVGLDRARSQCAMALPAPVTIAMMAYAEEAHAQAAMARRAGHELIVHLPMEPTAGNGDPGPNALLRGLTQDEFARRLDWNLSQFAGYVGINNHMGSVLTSDPAALAPVMAALKRRGLLFLDSRTTSDTQGLAVARAFGVPAIERDVFIDHDPSPIAVRTALVHIEDLAQANGFAVAIGHPRDVTLDALEEWLPDLKRRGFAVVPLTAIVRHAAADG